MSDNLPVVGLQFVNNLFTYLFFHRFIYKYLKDKRSKEADAPDSDDESVNSEDFNEAIKVNVDDKDLDFANNIENVDENDEDEDENEDENEEDEENEDENDSDEENVEFESLDEESGSDSERDLDDDFMDEFDPVSMTSKNVSYFNLFFKSFIMGPIIHFFDGRSPSRHKQNFFT